MVLIEVQAPHVFVPVKQIVGGYVAGNAGMQAPTGRYPGGCLFLGVTLQHLALPLFKSLLRFFFLAPALPHCIVSFNFLSQVPWTVFSNCPNIIRCAPLIVCQVKIGLVLAQPFEGLVPRQRVVITG